MVLSKHPMVAALGMLTSMVFKVLSEQLHDTYSAELSHFPLMSAICAFQLQWRGSVKNMSET